MRYPKLTRFGLSLAVLITLAGSAERPARADEIDDYTRKLIELDQRVHVMSLEFKETPAPPADVADRRVLDAQVLFGLKNFQEAATVLLDVIEKYPQFARLRRRALPARRVAVPGRTTPTRRATTSRCSCSATPAWARSRTRSSA